MDRKIEEIKAYPRLGVRIPGYILLRAVVVVLNQYRTSCINSRAQTVCQPWRVKGSTWTILPRSRG